MLRLSYWKLAGLALMAGSMAGVASAQEGIAKLHGNYANDGGAQQFAGGGQSQYYVIDRSQVAGGYENYRPNPTYFTQIPCPLGPATDCYGNPRGIWTIPAVRWAVDPNYYAMSPDYGWSPPSKWAIVRNAAVYQRYTPDQWYGTGKGQNLTPSFPMVAQPTDTTQMGYYYQTVPQWQPNPRMLPPPPDPRAWHYYENRPGADGMVTRWVKLENVWVPMSQIPKGGAAAQPMPMPQPVPEVVPQPVEVPDPAKPLPPPAPPAPPAEKAADASDGAIQQTGFFRRLWKRE